MAKVLAFKQKEKVSQIDLKEEWINSVIQKELSALDDNQRRELVLRVFAQIVIYVINKQWFRDPVNALSWLVQKVWKAVP